ncbi:methyl-accepting chemotaxis protein [Desulfogranum japonicum]|uniref:methyl-accepting chemotaxis protein n=1 Tax=Desulfogranum japonicum TaxID=231447 RepID=UPI00040D4D82|nr:methyl-accepting chemotaxis protein [Desulfogranum japonicum]
MDRQGLTSTIRGKLGLAFFAMIVLTLVVGGIAFFSQQAARTTINRVVDVEAQIARLALQTGSLLKTAEGNEKDFFLYYKSIGIQEAKEQYSNQALVHSGQVYNLLTEILELVPQEGRAAVDEAIAAATEYTDSFLATIDIIELREDPTFGELTKLNESIEAVQNSIGQVGSLKVNDLFYRLNGFVQQYIFVPSDETYTKIQESLAELKEAAKGAGQDAATQNALAANITELDKWLTEVHNTDKTIAERTAAYRAALATTEPVIEGLLSKAAASETQAVTAMEQKTQFLLYLIIGVIALAVLIGILLAIVMSRGLTRQVDNIMDLFSEVGMGNFDARTEVVSSDELGTMATTLNAMLDNITILIQSQDERDQIQESMMKLMDEISALMDGDLTGRAEVTEDITGAIADSFNTMAEQFSDIIRQVKNATASVDDTSADVTKLTLNLADKSLAQSEQVRSAIESIDRMAESIREVSGHAVKSAQVSDLSREHAKEGAEAVLKTNMAMDEIREQINETARSIKRLGESSLEIGNVVQIIHDIADRTSILALNASIQAAMAGDAGHGFAVVAEEVQRLAESSTNSTKQIDNLVKSIQTEIKDASNRMDESISKVVQGTKLADNAHEKLQEIERVADQMATLIDSITTAATRQVQVSEVITSNMQEVGHVSEETSKASQETANLMNMLSDTAHRLREAVETFKVDSTANA